MGLIQNNNLSAFTSALSTANALNLKPILIKMVSNNVNRRIVLEGFMTECTFKTESVNCN
jgi:hypothetical protein